LPASKPITTIEGQIAVSAISEITRPAFILSLKQRDDDGTVVVRPCPETGGRMPGRSAATALHVMTDREEEMLEKATDRFERRLAEECGQLRVEIASASGSLRAEMAQGFGALRAEMIVRNAELLKWILVQSAAVIGVVAALLALFR
jgi:hypothetical protein